MKRLWTCLALLVLTVLLAVSASAATIEIDTADELALLMQKNSAYPWDGDYVLTANINMAGKAQSPIGNTTTAFTGTFDGGNHTISGLNISGTGRVGLFGKINSATVKNLTVEGTITSTGNCAAGIVGEAVISSTIENCVNKCDVTITNGCIAAAGIVGYIRESTTVTVKDCVNEGDITATRALGGIVGWIFEKSTSDITISGCSNSGAIKSTRVVTNASTTAEADMADVGGILGLAGDFVSNKTAAGTGKVTVKQCKNTGAVEGYFYIGGIVGRMWGSDTSMTGAKHVVSECWNSGAITSLRNNGRAHVGGIIGYVNQVGNIYDCLNTGVIKGITDGIGGLFGSSGGSGKGVGAKNCLNKTAVQTYGTATSYSGYDKTKYVNSIGGYMAVKPAGTCYYVGTLQGSVWTNGTAKSTQYTASDFATLNENGVWSNAQSPELSCFMAAHTHEYNTYKDLENGTHVAACSCGEAKPGATPASHDFGTTGVCVCGAAMDLSVITTAEQILILMNATALWTNGDYTLGNDIDLSTYTGTLDQHPIGNATTPFTGTFDGKNFTISGLAINESGNNVGLFGAIGAATVKNVTVEGSVKGGSFVGGIVGLVGSTSKGVTATIDNCHNKATVFGVGKIGGVVGYFHGSDFETASIKNCSNSGKVTATGEDIGGVAGIFWEVSAEKLTNTAEVSSSVGKVGGIVGRATGNLDLSELKNSAKITAGGNAAGGIIGMLMNTPGTTLSASENSGAVTTTKNAAGGIVGDIQLRSSTADNAAIDTCVNSGKIVAEGEYAGGITGLLHESAGMTTAVGANNALTIEKCENYGDILAKRYGGGIVGAFRGSDTKDTSSPRFVLAECQSDATVITTATADTNGMGADVGGVAGLLYGVGDVNNCRSTGTVHGAVQYVGGFVGRIVSNTSIANCYADCYVTCDKADASYVRGFCGYPNAKKMNDCYYNADKCADEATNESEFNAVGGTTPKAYSRLVFDALNGDGKWVAMTSPELALYHTAHDNTQGGIDNGDGTHTPICPCGDESTKGTVTAHEYDGSGLCGCGAEATLASEISTADQLVKLMRYSNLWDGDYVLTANINLSGKSQSPIGTPSIPFTGTFDGQGHTISGLNIHTDEYAGLFGVATHAEIRNLTVSGTVKATGTYAGGIVAYAGIRNNSTNTFVIENCQNKATVTGSHYVGGIVGYLVGSDMDASEMDTVIRHCYNSGKITATSTTDVNDVGGIAGILWNVGEARNLYATGKITASYQNAGGIIGRTAGYASISNCYANAEVVGATAGIAYIRAFCGKPDGTLNVVACYYNSEKTSNEEAAIGWRIYEEAAFAYLNEDGVWLHASLAELTAYHTKHNNKLAVVDNGDGTHSPVCPCGASKGAAVAHTYDINLICKVCGNADRCAHVHVELYMDGEANCLGDALLYERCANCLVKLTPDGEETVVSDPENHSFVWTVENGVPVCACALCGEVSDAVTAPATFTDLYVSNKGYADGGFSEQMPLNDFGAAMALAATQSGDVTVHILDSVNVPLPTGAVSVFTYLEPAHTNKITVCGSEKTHGVLSISGADAKVIYGLNGPTTFENVEFCFGSTEAYFYLVARHNPLVLGEGISADFNRVNASGTHSGNIYVIGGCYESHFADNCAGKPTDVTICSGTYRTIIGGHYSGKNCGNTGDISLKLLGDITTRNQITAGNVGVASGKISLTVDGNLSIGTFFTFGSQAVNKQASETVVLVESGSIVLNNFFANPNSQISTLTVGAVDASHNVLAYTKKLTVYVNENSPSAMALRETLYASVFSAVNMDQNSAEKVLFLFMGEDGYCKASGATHTANGAAIETVASTCIAEGYEIYVCSACTEEYVVALPLEAHEYDADSVLTIDATCIAPEMEKAVCTTCGYAKHTIVGNAFADHTDPEKTGFCQVCNLDLTANCEHIFGEDVPFASGCGTGTKRTCSECGKVEVEVYGDGHNYGKYVVTVEPTATMAGVKSRTCKGCGKVETAIMYATDALNADALATDASGNLADLAIESSKLTKGERAALNALLQQDAYGSEVKISYETDASGVTNITYSIPVPAEYTEYENVKVVVRDDEGKIHFVNFMIDKGYIVFTF